MKSPDRDAADELAERIEVAAKAMQSRNALFMLRDIPWDSITEDERLHWINLADAAIQSTEHASELATLRRRVAEDTRFIATCREWYFGASSTALETLCRETFRPDYLGRDPAPPTRKE